MNRWGIGKSLMAKITIGFIGGVLLLAFFSRAIYQYNLPAVTVDFLTADSIIHSTSAEATVVLGGEKDLICESDGVIDIFVEKGVQVLPGDLLYRLTADLTSVSDEISDLNHERDMLQVKISKIDSDIVYQLENPPNRAYPNIDLRDFDYNRTQIEREIEQETAELERLVRLFDQGAIAENEVRQQQTVLDDLELSLEKNMEDRQKAIEDHEQQVVDIEKKSVEDNTSWTKTINDLNFQQRENSLRLSHINRQLEELRRRLENDGIVEVYAEASGVVTAVYDNSRTGRYIGKNTPILSIQPEDAQNKAIFALSNDIDYIAEGDDVTLRIRARNLNGLPGIVDKTYYNEEKLMAEVVFEAEGLHGGERVEGRFQSDSKAYDYVLPNTAIREGEYIHVLYVEQIKTSYGYDYVTRMRNIGILEEGKTKTAIMWGNYENEAVVINSDRPLLEDMKVKIVGGSDIIDTR